MARKNPFEKLLNDQADKSEASRASTANYPAKGASRSIMNTLDDLTDKADKLMEGETIVELDTELIEPSFFVDRLDDDPTEFEKLKKAIEDEGQSTPILVRPHPNVDGKYMVVFGSRRKKVAESLGIPVRAIVKDLTDREHIVAQGQENAVRANLSFIERARMAANVIERKFDNDNTTAMSALSVDKSTLSKMLSVSMIAEEILSFIGSARSVGRDRWYELKTLLDNPRNLKQAILLIDDEALSSFESDKRFEALLQALKGKKKTTNKISAKAIPWSARDKTISIEHSSKGKSYMIAAKANDDSAVEFGKFLSSNLDAYYEAFIKQKSK